MNLKNVIHYVAIPTLCLGLAEMAVAAGPDMGYVVDSSGTSVKDNYTNCVRSAFPDGKIPPGCGAETPAPKPAPRVERAVPPPSAPVITKTAIEAKALFATNKYTLKPAGKASLDKLAREIKNIPGIQEIHVIGHTDSVGSDAYNQRLSMNRAATVKSYLEQKGLRSITAEGRGEREPVASNATEAGRAQNRRVEIEEVIR